MSGLFREPASPISAMRSLASTKIKIAALSRSRIPIYEPGLAALVGHDVADWDFGLTTRDRQPKQALLSLSTWFCERAPSVAENLGSRLQLQRQSDVASGSNLTLGARV
jgi:hypothetical protein